MMLKILFPAFILLLVMPFCRSDSTIDMITSHLYPAEKHEIKTTDGYILSLYRIPNVEKRKNGRKSKKVVLFAHGMTAAAPSFVTFPNQSAAYKFSDAGYDVWMLNARGNTYSKQHVNMTTDDPKFWRFSWHEIGIYDIPETIDYILNITNQKKLSYVGHSQGGTALFVMLSVLPQYNDKITIAHALAPAIILKHNHPILTLLLLRNANMNTVNKLTAWLEKSKLYEVFAHAATEPILRLASLLCMLPGGGLCRNLIFIIFGPTTLYSDDLVYLFMNHLPAGASYRQFVHYIQIIVTQKFQHYDYGSKASNMKAYGSAEPPLYDLSKVRANIHIMHGTNDWLSPSLNVPLFANAMGRYPVAISEFTGYNHVDFVYTKHLEKVNSIILKLENQYQRDD